MKRATLALTPLLLLAACGGSSHTSSSTSTSKDGGSASSPSSSASSASSSGDAASQAQKIKAANPDVTSLTAITQANDTNKELGRPNGYTSAEVLNIKGQTCDGAPGVACGATIEDWQNAGAATARAQYIQNIYSKAASLGSEYDYVNGSNILRVTGKVDPDVAKKLNDSFGGTLAKASN